MSNLFMLSMQIICPIVGGTFILLCGEQVEKLQAKVAVLVSLLAYSFMIPLLMFSGAGHVFHAKIFQIIPNIWITFRVDQLSVIFAAATAGLWLLCTIYSLGYMKGESSQGRYYGFLTLTLGFMMGLAFAGNLFTLLIFYELMSLSCFPLIAHYQTDDVMAAAKKYLIYILSGSIFIIGGIVAVYLVAGQESFALSGVMPQTYNKGALIAIFMSLIVGFGVKAAIMPFHGWVPDAHPAAPSSFSALLSGVIVASGAYGIARVIFNTFGVELVKALSVQWIILTLAGITIIVASLIALEEDDLKRRLAYSTIGQMSYIVLGLILLTPSSMTGAVVHIVNHAFMKGVLFLCAGVIIKQTGKRRISEMAGIGKKYPLTMTAFTIASLGLIGTPPLAGFISKWYLGMGTIEAGQIGFLVVILLGSLICAAYLLPVCSIAIFKKGATETLSVDDNKEGVEKIGIGEIFETTPPSMLWPIFLGVILIVILGIFACLPGFPVALFKAGESLLFGLR